MGSDFKFNILWQEDHLAETWRQAPTFRHAVADLRCLNFLRLTALSCRVKPKVDLFRACALLQNSRSKSLAAHADALIRSLPEALGKTPRFFRPGTPDLSFDEAWVLQLQEAQSRNDQDSLDFLLRSRVLPQYRRQIGFLAARTSAIFLEV